MNVSLFQDAHLRRVGAPIQPEEIYMLVASALGFFIQNVFANITNTFVITTSTLGGSIVFWLHDIMSKIFTTWSILTVQLVVQDHKTKRIEVPGKRNCNIIMIDSFKSLEKTYIAEYNEHFDSLEYYLIFLQTADRLIPHEMEKIFRYCFDNYWIHCNVMIQNGKGEILIYTYFPFEEKNCFQTKAKLINQFKGNRFVNEIMFPDKLLNLHRCSLKVNTWEAPPFIINSTSPNYPVHKFSGFEMTMLVAISRAMNFTLDIEMISIDLYHENAKPSDIPLNMLKNRETNITMGYFIHTAARDRVATPSYVTYYMSLVAVILRKESRFETMGIFIFPFDRITWGLIILVYGLIYLLNTFNTRDRRVNDFHIYEVLIGMPISILPTSASRRISFLTMLLSSFILRSIYQSLLFHLFRTHFYKAPPLTLESLVENGYKAVSSEISLNFTRHVPQIKDRSLPLLLIYSSNELFPFVYLEINANENFAAISAYDVAVYYANNILSIGRVLQILPINVNEQQIGFYFVKHSYLLKSFNKHIFCFQQAGLLEKWKEWSHGVYEVHNIHSSTSYENALMVNLKQLVGIFFVILFLHLAAIVCFSLELLSKRLKCLKRFFE